MSENKSQAVPNSSRNEKKKKPKRNAKADGAKTKDNIPKFLKLSPKFLEWKRFSNKLSADLKDVSMTISELGKAIADYSAKGATFAFDKELVERYEHFERLRIGWESFRDSFRAEDDAASVPTGIASKLLAGGTTLAPPTKSGNQTA
jgi:hypothetical protein